MKDIKEFVNYVKENGNIISTCKGCGDQKLFDFLNNNGIEELLLSYETSKNLHVKSKFIQDEKVEHMWVKVITFVQKEDGYYMQGILDNDPVLVDNVNCGDIVDIKLESISNFIADNKCFMPLV